MIDFQKTKLYMYETVFATAICTSHLLYEVGSTKMWKRFSM